MSLPLAIYTFPGEYKPYRYVPPQRVWFVHRFGLKTGIDLAHLGLESGIVFEGTTGMYEAIKLEAFIKTGFIWIVSSRKTEGFERCFTFLSREACPYRLY